MHQLIRPILLSLVVCSFVFGTLVWVEMKKAGPERTVLQVSGAVLDNLVEVIGAIKPDPKTSLPSLLPADGTNGWARSDYRQADSAEITGEPYRETLISVSTNNDITTSFVQAASRSRNKAAVQTFRRGDAVVIIQINFTPPNDMDEPGFIVAERLRGMWLTPDGDLPAGSLIAAPGVLFKKWAQTNTITRTREEFPVAYHRYQAYVGRQVGIFVAAVNTDPADLQALLEQIDLTALHATNEAPDPWFGERTLALRDRLGAMSQFADTGADTGAWALLPDSVEGNTAAEDAALQEALNALVANGSLSAQGAEQAAEVTVQRGIATRGGTTCVIENGVRRCRIGN